VLAPTGHAPLTMAVAAFVGATLGFLVFNRRPASIFMGDSGSLFIGSLPHLYPLARVNDQFPRYAALIVDTNSAQLFVFGLATTELRPDRPSCDIAGEVTFEEQDGRTLMTAIQSGFPTLELREEHGRGVPDAFARLERAIRASR